MAMKLLTLLSITFSIFAAASAADQNNGDNSIVGAAWSADQSNEDSTTEETHILLPENPESCIAMPELSPESYITLPESEETTSSSDGGDFILSTKRKTCDKYPPVCRETSSPGPDCCKKKCTDITKDPYNCGMCGRKCKHNQTCCSGHCVNTSSDPRNCGRCGHKCKKWEICVYGMCSYA